MDEEPYYRKPRRSLKERLADEGIDISEDEDPQLQNRVKSYTDLEVLEMAAEAVKRNDAQYRWATEADKSALDIFLKRASVLKAAQNRRTELLEQKNALADKRFDNLTSEEAAEYKRLMSYVTRLSRSEKSVKNNGTLTFSKRADWCTSDDKRKRDA